MWVMISLGAGSLQLVIFFVEGFSYVRSVFRHCEVATNFVPVSAVSLFLVLCVAATFCLRRRQRTSSSELGTSTYVFGLLLVRRYVSPSASL